MIMSTVFSTAQLVLEFHLCGTGVLLMWYWKRTYMHKSGIPIDEFLVFKINCTIYGFFFRIKLSDTSAFANKLSKFALAC